MKLLYRALPAAALALTALPALGTEIVACMVAPLPNNPHYFGTATTITKLKCEFTNKDYYPTLAELYRQGWRLIQVIGAGQALSNGGQTVSPLYLLEREAAAVPATAPAESKSAGKKK